MLTWHPKICAGWPRRDYTPGPLLSNGSSNFKVQMSKFICHLDFVIWTFAVSQRWWYSPNCIAICRDKQKWLVHVVTFEHRTFRTSNVVAEQQNCRYPCSPRPKLCRLAVPSIDPRSGVANAISLPPGKYGRKAKTQRNRRGLAQAVEHEV